MGTRSGTSVIPGYSFRSSNFLLLVEIDIEHTKHEKKKKNWGQRQKKDPLQPKPRKIQQKILYKMCEKHI